MKKRNAEKKEAREEYPAGRDLLRIILDSLLRAGLKSIPGPGTFVDQTIFGTKEAIRDAKVIKILEETRGLLAQMEGDLPDATGQQDFLARIERLFEQQEETVKRISEKIETLKPDVFAALTKSMAELVRRHAKDHGVDEDIAQVRKILRKFRIDIRSDIKKEISTIESRLADFQDKLGKAQSCLKSSDAMLTSLTFQEIIQSFRNDTSHETLLEMTNSYEKIVNLMDGLDTEKPFTLDLSVDFSEVYTYSFAYAKPKPESAYDMYFFTLSKSPFFLLPGGLVELIDFANKSRTKLFDYHTLRTDLSLKLEIARSKLAESKDLRSLINVLTPEERFILFESTSHPNSPFARMRSLLEDHIVIPMSDYRFPEPYNKQFKQALDLLDSYRPLKKYANYFDAANIALLCQINHDLVSTRRLLGHVSGSHVTRQVAQHVINRHITLRKDLKLVPSLLILTPEQCAFKCYLERQSLDKNPKQRATMQGLLVRCDEMLSIFNDKRQMFLAQLQSPSANSLLGLSDYFSVLVASLQSYRTELIHPFYDAVQKAEYTHLGDDVASWDESHLMRRFDEVYEQLVTEVTQLIVHLEPLRSSFESFRELASKHDLPPSNGP